MKIITLTFRAGHNKENTETLSVIEQCARTGTLCDTVMLTHGKPVFIPDWGERAVAYPSLAVRISRLGKSIEARFAPRYYDAVAPALVLEMADIAEKLRAAGADTTMARSFDGAVPTGRFSEAAVGEEEIRFTLGRESRKYRIADSPDYISRAIAEASLYFSIRQGDVMLLPLTEEGIPVKPDTHVEGMIGVERLLSFNIK